MESLYDKIFILFYDERELSSKPLVKRYSTNSKKFTSIYKCLDDLLLLVVVGIPNEITIDGNVFEI